MDKGNKRETVIALVICFLLAFGLWFYVENLENPIRERDLTKVPVEIQNADYLENYGLALAPNQEFYVTLKLSGPATEIYKVAVSDFKISVDLSEYAIAKGTKKIPIKIEESPSNISIKNINTLMVDITFEEAIKKNVKITSDLKVTTQQGYFAGQPQITPGEVKVSGAETLVNEVARVVVEGNVDNVSEDVTEKYQLKALDESGKEIQGVNLSITEAEVKIKVTKGKSVPIKVNQIGSLKNGSKVKSLDLSITNVQLVGPKEKLDAITEVNTEALDLSKYSGGETISLGMILPSDVSTIPGQEKVDVTINETKVITKDFDIVFNTIGLSEDYTIEIPIKTVQVRVTGYEDQVSEITTDKLKAELNVENTVGKHSVRPNVTIIGGAEGIKAEALNEISYIITKK